MHNALDNPAAVNAEASAGPRPACDTPPSTHGPDGDLAAIDAEIRRRAALRHSGRDIQGRFLPGNHCGGGNPMAGRAAKLRAELLRMATKMNWGVIARKLGAMAEGGDLAAIQMLHSLGWPPAGRELKLRMEALETNLRNVLERIEALEPSRKRGRV
jgi:hypothetical protein